MKCKIFVVYVVYTWKASKIELHQSKAASTWWCSPQPHLGWVKMAVGLTEGPSYTPLTQTIFSSCSPLNDRRRVARSLFKIGLSSLFSCPFFTHLLILLLMSSNVHPHPYLVFPCSVCAGNVTWWGRSVQCCTCTNWVYLKCSLLSFSRVRTLGRSHSCSCSPCCIPAFFGDATLTSTVTYSLDFSGWYASTAESGPLLLMQHSHLTLAFKPLILFPHFVFSPSSPSPLPNAPGCFSLPPAFSSPA